MLFTEARIRPGLAMPRIVVVLGVLLSFLPLTRVSHAEEIDQKLIKQSRAESEILWRKGFTLGDTELDAELQSMLDRLVADAQMDPAIVLKVQVFRSPELNAFAMPDGSIYVFAGLLATFNSTDELAFILGHEAQHSIGWHAQHHISQYKSTRAFLEIISIATTIALGAASFSGAGLVDMFSQLGLILVASYAITGYGRELENEADIEGVAMMQEAGYDECGSLYALNALLDEHEDPNRVANFFWGSHPLIQDRLEHAGTAIQQECSAGLEIVTEDYAHIKWPMMKLRARLWNSDEQPEKGLESASGYVEVFPDDPEIHCVIGDSHRQIATDDALRLANEFYTRALELAEDYREPLLGLCLTAEAEQDTVAAITYLGRYLAGDERVPKRRAMTRRLKVLKEAYGWMAPPPEPPGQLKTQDNESEKGS